MFKRFQPKIVLRLFLFFSLFQPHCSYKVVLTKKNVAALHVNNYHFKVDLLSSTLLEDYF